MLFLVGPITHVTSGGTRSQKHTNNNNDCWGLDHHVWKAGRSELGGVQCPTTKPVKTQWRQSCRSPAGLPRASRWTLLLLHKG